MMVMIVITHVQALVFIARFPFLSKVSTSIAAQSRSNTPCCHSISKVRDRSTYFRLRESESHNERFMQSLDI
jgi:hypothetical protein